MLGLGRRLNINPVGTPVDTPTQRFHVAVPRINRPEDNTQVTYVRAELQEV